MCQQPKTGYSSLPTRDTAVRFGGAGLLSLSCSGFGHKKF